MNTTFDYSVVDTIIAANGNSPRAIISILQDIQEHYNYLPREVFPYIAEKLGISEAKAYSVATRKLLARTEGQICLRIATVRRAMGALDTDS